MLADFRRVNPASPRLTWYGSTGERIELSGKVLDNWVAKTANFLVDEFDFGPGMSLSLDLPAHWKSLCILLGALAAGGTVTSAQGGTLLASSDQQRLELDQRPAIAVSLAALALRWDGELGPQVRDYAAEVRMFADSFERFDDPAESQLALSIGELQCEYQQLSELRQEYSQADRIALDSTVGLSAVATTALGIWQSAGSLVLAEHRSLLTASLLSSEAARLR
ncbi:hypothetical protein UM93_00570 [Psychromicrobium lacuslunae]|uniref:TIGR03089 family protein n=1 Tax=Psychromicrobium lacuslunae TaxID=1618207 RepID=A0A0D4BWB9_9MICC|nr:hypothetical protein UM93_00570 [Psychromicrobium lacuslunae]